MKICMMHHRGRDWKFSTSFDQAKGNNSRKSITLSECKANAWKIIRRPEMAKCLSS